MNRARRFAIVALVAIAATVEGHKNAPSDFSNGASSPDLRNRGRPLGEAVSSFPPVAIRGLRQSQSTPSADTRPMRRCAHGCTEGWGGRLICIYWEQAVCSEWQIECSDLPPGAVCRPAVTRLGLWVPPNGPPPDPVMVRSLYFPVMRPEPETEREWKLDPDFKP